MLTQQPKKMMILYILDILRKYTDADHRLSQREIEDILRTEYNMPADRKAVRRNLMNLIDSGYNIEYSESVRMVTNSKTGELEESYILSDFYLSREFTDGELRLLIDSLLFSQHIPYSQCRELVKKLEGLSNNYFRSRVRYINRLPGDASDNKQLFLNIELLDEAICKSRKVAFEYLSYGTDKQLHPRVRSDGSTDYVVSPYQMVAKEGKYYLICNFDKYDDISNYRMDRIRNIRMEHAEIIGRYFLAHAKAAYSLMGADTVNKGAQYLLSFIKRERLTEFSRRDAMRLCRSFKTADSLQPVLNRLCEYGYIAVKPQEPTLGVGRRPSEIYLTNPAVLNT